jgi:hypothetical protein
MATYEEIREVGKSMYKKTLVASEHPDFTPIRMAKQMGIPVLGRRMMFDNEIEQDALANFRQ